MVNGQTPWHSKAGWGLERAQTSKPIRLDSNSGLGSAGGVKVGRAHHRGGYFSIQMQDDDVLDQGDSRESDEKYSESRTDLIC